MGCLTTLFGYLDHAPALYWRHYVYITMLYMNACMPRICRISVLYILETWTQMKTYAPHTWQQILRRVFGAVRSLTMQARGCGGGLYWKMHGRCGCPWSRYGEYPRLIVMSDAYKAHRPYPPWLYWCNLCRLSREILCNNHSIICICSASCIIYMAHLDSSTIRIWCISML